LTPWTSAPPRRSFLLRAPCIGQAGHNPPAEKNFKISLENPKVSQTQSVKGRQPAIRPGFQALETAMTSNEVLAMYENIAALTGRMATAANEGDMESLARLETQCAIHAAAARNGVPKLEGDQRKRKIDLLKQIMANDRAVRDVTEPWMGQLDRAMSAAH
jgi:flagellar protein FliT